jgi:hypothetical protein
MPCRSNPPWLHHYDYICEEYQLWSSSLCSFLQPPTILSLFGPNIPLSTLFSNTFSLCSSLNIRVQVSHPYKTTGKSIVVCYDFLRFLDNRRKDEKFLFSPESNFDMLLSQENTVLYIIVACKKQSYKFCVALRTTFRLRTCCACHLLSRRFLAWLIFRPWRWRRYVPPKRRLTFNGLHGVVSQKMVLFISTAVRTSNPTTENVFKMYGSGYLVKLTRRCWSSENDWNNLL